MGAGEYPPPPRRSLTPDALFARWLKSGTPPSAPARPARLRLEPLEPREVPAADVWVGHTTDFTDPANWSDGLPTAEDELYFTGQVSGTSTTFYVGPKTYPGSGGEGGGVGVGMGGEGDPPGDGPPGGDGSWTYTFPDHYVGIYLEGGYAGVVSFPSDLTFNHYWQDTGATAEYAPDLSVTVTSAFYWTGGIVNDTANAGTLDLKGVISGVIGTDASDLTTGSKIVLEGDGGYNTDVTARGTLNLVNTVGVEVLANCLLMLYGGGGGDQTLNQQQGADNTVTGEVVAAGNTTNGAGWLVEASGSLKVWKKSDGTKGGLTVNGVVNPNEIGSPSVQVAGDGAVLRILNGQTLKVSDGVEVVQGKLRTSTDIGLPKQVAYIDGTLTVRGGNVVLGDANGDSPTAYAQLHVTSGVLLLGGLFSCAFDANNDGEGSVDRIITDGTMMFSNAFVVVPVPSSQPLKAGLKWVIFYARDGFIDSIDATTTLGYTIARLDTQTVAIW